MKRAVRHLRRCVSTLLCLVLSGCGIDQGGVFVTGPPPGGTTQGATLIVSGPISGFGSVFVNGLRLETSTAQVLVDGRFAVEADLAIGQVIRAIAVEESGVLRALTIEHEEAVVGPIAAIDQVAGTLTVLGQSVVVDAGTRFDRSLGDVTGLQVNVPIVVSGLELPDGAIAATFIRRAGLFDDFQVAGMITVADASALTFDVGDLRVDYSQAVLVDLPTGSPETSLTIEARGNVGADDVLLATEVRAISSSPSLFTASAAALTDFERPLASAATADAVLEASVVAYVTTTNLPGEISLADITVMVDADTLIVGGVLADLGAGVKIQLEGVVEVFGQIRASRIELL